MRPRAVAARALAVGLAGGVGLLAAAEWRWRAETAAQIARLNSGAESAAPRTFSVTELEGLPAPVVRYFRAVLRDGQPVVRAARLTQEGTFLLRPGDDGWRPFTATQHFACGPEAAGFVWDAAIRVAPGVPARVRDAFLGGEGLMQARLLAVVPLAEVHGTPEIAAGALHRYLAEAVWCPTALLPSQGVRWEGIDDRRARATLSVRGTTVSLEFRFGGDGLIREVYTPARSRDVNGRAVPTPWRGRFSEYEERGGMLVPLSGEVEWVLPDGPQPYWRGRITRIALEMQGREP